ncbi:MAG: DUF3783 domain-containing protein [bacterium]|nr:DUF3783 domain-containing protein [bacterium]
MQKLNNKETILLYNIKNKPYTPKLKAILLRLGIRIKVINTEQYQLPIKDLLSNSASSTAVVTAPLAETPAAFEDEMMVMAGLTNTRLDIFLAALRKEGIRIPLKAVLTPHNSTWTSYALHDELVLEHAKMQELEK